MTDSVAHVPTRDHTVGQKSAGIVRWYFEVTFGRPTCRPVPHRTPDVKLQELLI